MANIIAIANQKGGVGKTTTVHNIGQALSQRKQKVLMVDLDPNATLTHFCGHEPDELSATIAHAIEKNSTITIKDTILNQSDNLCLAPASEELASVEYNMGTRTKREELLNKYLAPLADEYDYILLDCPAQLDLLTVNALSAADCVIIPCTTDYASYLAMQKLIEIINEIRDEINSRLTIGGVIATMKTSLAKDDNDILTGLQNSYNVLGVVKRMQAAKKNVYEGKPAVVTSPYCDVSLAYKSIADKIISMQPLAQ